MTLDQILQQEIKVQNSGFLGKRRIYIQERSQKKNRVSQLGSSKYEKS